MGEPRRINGKRVILASAVGLVVIAARLMVPAGMELHSKKQDLSQEESSELGSRSKASLESRSASFRPKIQSAEPNSKAPQQIHSPVQQVPSRSFGMNSRPRESEGGPAELRGLTGGDDLRLQERASGKIAPADPDTLGMGRLDPAMGAPAAGGRDFGPSRLAALEKVKIQFPSNQEMSGLDKLRSNPQVDDRALQQALPRREPSAAESAAKEQKELAKIKKEMGMPAPKAKLDAALYDPWAHEYDSLVRSEEAKANKIAQEALKARQAELRARKKSVQ